MMMMDDDDNDNDRYTYDDGDDDEHSANRMGRFRPDNPFCIFLNFQKKNNPINPCLSLRFPGQMPEHLLASRPRVPVRLPQIVT